MTIRSLGCPINCEVVWEEESGELNGGRSFNKNCVFKSAFFTRERALIALRFASMRVKVYLLLYNMIQPLIISVIIVCHK
jgi:hypothetical protein